jgi:hypothetical protein
LVIAAGPRGAVEQGRCHLPASSIVGATRVKSGPPRTRSITRPVVRWRQQTRSSAVSCDGMRPRHAMSVFHSVSGRDRHCGRFRWRRCGNSDGVAGCVLQRLLNIPAHRQPESRPAAYRSQQDR